MKLIIISAIALIVNITGCAKPLSPAGALVTIVDKTPDDCKSLGEVYGTSTTNFHPVENLKNARNEMRDEAAKLGGNMVVLQTSTQRGTQATLSGQAYKCK